MPCNLLALLLCLDDSNVIADPMFTVPLAGSMTPSLCYEIYGLADKYFNFLSERCISVNAHYTSVPTGGSTSRRPLHLIDKFGIRVATTDSPICFDVLIELVDGHCLVSYNGVVVRNGEFRSGGLHLTVSKSIVTLSVPNCGKGKIVLKFQSKTTKKPFLEFQIEDGAEGITPSAHGLIGMSIICSSSSRWLVRERWIMY